MPEWTRSASLCAALLALPLAGQGWAIAPALAGEAASTGKAEEALEKALAPKPSPEALRNQKLDELFERLRNAHKPDEAQQIALSIERLWLHSLSDTANLLMQRAGQAVDAQNFPLALELLDKLVLLEPDWAEAWNERGAIKFMTGDLDGARADFEQAIRLEPRHFGALSGLGLILERQGFSGRASEVFSKVRTIYPLAPDIPKPREKSLPEEDGKDI